MNTRIIQALKIRSFLFLWLAEVFSQIAMNMMNFILILVAYALTNSNTAVSGIVLTIAVPAVLFGILAAAYVDRWDKKSVLLGANALRAVLLGILAIFHRNLWVVYIVSFLVSIITQFFIPAETPIIPLIVKNEMLFSANALFGIALYGAVLLAYAFSGPALIFFKTTNSLLLLAFLFLIASVFVLLIKEPKLHIKRVHEDFETSLLHEIRQTLSIILKTKELYRAFILIVLSQILVLIISVLGPGYARQILGIHINEFPLLFVTPATIGMIVGAIILTSYAHKFSRNKSATVGLFLAGICVMLMPYGSKVTSRAFVHTINAYLPHLLQINILHIMVVLAFIIGFALAVVFVPSNTILQEKTSDEIRGKIYGTLNTTGSLLSLLPIIMAGSLADLFGVAAVLTAVGIFIALMGIGTLFL